METELVVRKHTRWFDAALSYVGRPTMFSGFYCTRAAGQFCVAVGALILICDVLKIIAPGPVVVASSIIMVLCIFAAGATNIAGAGALAFGAMVFITLYVFLGIQDPSIIFHEWSYVLVFWMIVPLINMVFDSARWLIVKKMLNARISAAHVTSATYLVWDIIVMLLSLSALSFLGPNIIRWYNSLAVSHGQPAPIPIDAFLNEAATNFWQGGIWFGIMLFSVLIPTVINVGIFLSAGIMRLIPNTVRSRFADECEDWSLSRREIDWLAWRISVIGSLTGIIFFMIALLTLGYVVAWLAPAVGEILYYLATVKLF